MRAFFMRKYQCLLWMQRGVSRQANNVCISMEIMAFEEDGGRFDIDDFIE